MATTELKAVPSGAGIIYPSPGTAARCGWESCTSQAPGGWCVVPRKWCRQVAVAVVVGRAVKELPLCGESHRAKAQL